MYEKYSQILHQRPQILGIVCAILCGACLYFFTPFGLGLTPDAVAYLKGAQGLLSGHGVQYMSGQWPPLYPLTIAAVSAIFDSDVISGARVLQALLYASNFMLIVQLLRRCFAVPLIFAVFFSGLLIVQPVLIHVHFYAWSEPLFIFFVLLNFLLLTDLKVGGKASLLVLLVAVTASLALMTRFVGISLIFINCVVFLWIFRNAAVMYRIAYIASQLVIALAILWSWIGHRAITDGPATERWLTVNPISQEILLKAVAVIGSWLTPFNGLQYDPHVSLFAVLAGGIVLIAPLLLLARSILKRTVPEGKDVRFDMILSGVLFFYAYCGTVLAAWIFVDNKVHLDNRLFSPMCLTFGILIIGSIWCLRAPLVKWVGLAILSLLLMSAYPSLRGTVLLSAYRGLEMASVDFTQRPINRYVAGCNKAAIVYADRPWNFDLYFSTKVFWLPDQMLYYKRVRNESFDPQWETMLERADLVVMESADALRDKAKLMPEFWKVLYEGPGGTVWGRPTAECLASPT